MLTQAQPVAKKQQREFTNCNHKEKGLKTAEDMFDKDFGAKGCPERISFEAESHAWYLGELIHERRMKLGIKQKDLALLVGCTTKHISKIERGETDTNLSIFLRIANALNIKVGLTNY